MKRLGFRGALVTAGTILVVQGLWGHFQWGGESVTTAFSDFVGIPVPIWASIACWAVARTERGRVRRGWILIGLGTLSWALGETVWTYYEVVLGQEVPFPGAADIGFLGQLPLGGAGLLLIHGVPRGAISRVRTLLDGLIIGTSMLTVSWALVLGPLFRGHFGTVLEQGLGLAYPAGDLIIFSLVLFVAVRSPKGSRGPLAWIGLGLAAIGIADSAFIGLSLTDSFATGGLVDLGWTLGFCLIALGAIRRRAERAAPEQTEFRASHVGTLLPYFAVLLALVVGSYKQITGGALEPFLFFMSVSVFALVASRQLLTLLENLALNRTLEHKVSERTAELREREQRFRSLVQNSSDMITIVDPEGVITYQSGSVERVLRYDAHQMVGTTLTDLVHPLDRAGIVASIAQALSQPGEPILMTARMRHRDGHWRHAESRATNLLSDPSVRGVVLNTRDVTERTELESQLTHQAFHDALTGLANRALFRDRVEHALARVARNPEILAVLFLDLDEFKAINDSLGHATGDTLLTAMAERLRIAVRPGDTIARLGGDEFAVLVEGADHEADAIRVAERVLTSLKTPFMIEGREVFVRASIGIAMAQELDGPDELLRNADVAMYMAKAHGKGNFRVFEPAMHTTLVAQLELETDLRRALEREEFVLRYQPVFDLQSNRIVGAEALIRWNHPRRGLIPPSEFIPLAETTGMIVAIGEWALDEACRQAKHWHDRSVGAPLDVAVNLSARQLQEPALAGQVRAALDRSGLPSECLVLELTESILMEDTETVMTRLHELKAIGIRLGIDDFGTGYSSLSYLKRFPVDILKIDRAFVSDLGKGIEEGALVYAIVKLARALNLQTIAEGIERPEQLAELLRIGCTTGQGFHFSQPVEASAIETFIALRDPVPA